MNKPPPLPPKRRREEEDGALRRPLPKPPLPLWIKIGFGVAVPLLPLAIWLFWNEVTADVAVERAWEYEAEGDDEAALRYYRRALDADDENVDAWRGAGIKLHDRRDWAEAERHYRRALELEPEDADTHAWLGSVLYEQRELAEAEASWKRALALDDEISDAHYGMALLDWEAERWPEAEARLRRAARLDPTNMDTVGMLGRVLHHLDRSDEGLALIRDAERRNPANGWITHCLGLLHALRGEHGAAESALRRARDLDPENLEACIAHSEELRELDREQDAQEVMQLASRRWPGDARVWIELGAICEQEGKTSAALRHYEHALELDPDEPTAAAWAERVRAVLGVADD